MKSHAKKNRLLYFICAFSAYALLFLGAAALAQPAGCPPGMTHYWKFDETLGGPFADFYGTTAATCANCPTAATGKVNGAQQFDGTNDQVDVADDGSFDWTASSSFTIEFWMRSPGCACTQAGYDCNQVLVGRAGAVTPWWIGLNCQTNGHVGKLRCYFGGSPLVDFYSNAFVNDNLWHHVVFQFDQGAGQYRLYIDGVLDNSQAEIGKDRTGTAVLQVGYYSTAYRYAGLLDELALYSGVLTTSEIASHNTAGGIGQGYCNVSQAPVIGSTPVTSVVVGQAYSYDVDASGSPVPTYSLNVWPAGMTIEETTGVIGWLPLETGDFNVEVQATNMEGTGTQAFTITVNPVSVCTPGLTHYWKLDETSGMTCIDAQGGHHAHCSNCPTPVAGHVGGAQELDRTDDGLNVADDGSFDWGINDSYSIEFWLNESTVCAGTTQPNNEVVVGRSGGGWWIGVNCETPLPTQKIRAYFQGTELFSTTVVNDGIWHHVVFVRDAIAGAYGLHIDGVAEATITASGKNLAAADSLTIGYFNGPAPGKYRYGGIVDEMAFYNKPLTAETISSHYNQGFGGRYCYLCGNADGNGMVNISDAVLVISFIFSGGNPPSPLLAGDADCNGFINISDAVYVISYIFGGGAAPCANCR